MAAAPVSKESIIGHGAQYPRPRPTTADNDKTHPAADHTWEPPSAA
jgi:hypothetical protein